MKKIKFKKINLLNEIILQMFLIAILYLQNIFFSWILEL